MKSRFLIPRVFTGIGLLLIVLGIILGITYLNGDILSFLKKNNTPASTITALFERDNYQGDLALTFLIIGLFMTGFSKLKLEDEFTDYLRYQSLLLTVIIQSTTLILSSWIIGGITFISVSNINLFGFLFVYNIIFRVVFYINQQKVRE